MKNQPPLNSRKIYNSYRTLFYFSFYAFHPEVALAILSMNYHMLTHKGTVNITVTIRHPSTHKLKKIKCTSKIKLKCLVSILIIMFMQLKFCFIQKYIILLPAAFTVSMEIKRKHYLRNERFFFIFILASPSQNYCY